MTQYACTIISVIDNNVALLKCSMVLFRCACFLNKDIAIANDFDMCFIIADKYVSLDEISRALKPKESLELLLHPEHANDFLRAIEVDDQTLKRKEDRINFQSVLLIITEKEVSKNDIHSALISVGLSDFAEEWKENYMHPSQYILCTDM